MLLGWNEIKQRAMAFSREWGGETREHAEAKSFWDAFFNVFGISRRSVATFEAPVRKLGGQYGFIDLFWKGKLLVEHKSRGQNLEHAESQAFGYLQALANEGRLDELPHYVIVTDFDRLELYDLEPDDVRGLPLFCGQPVLRTELRVADLHRHVHLFGFIPGYKVRSFAKEDPINIKAAEVMGRLHDAMKASGYEGHALERFLVRVLFCLFAEDTGIFEQGAFTEYIENGTRPDGADSGPLLARFFQVLDTPKEKRQTNLDERLAALPYVNGALFAEALPLAEMSRAMRDALLVCTRFDWSRISPAVFGSLFQAVMLPEERRRRGAHYTSERDILKVIHALFLDDLRAEFEAVKHDRRKLDALHRKIGTLRFFDPACGCGNFLVIAYRELRLLENEILSALYGAQQALDIVQLSRVDVDAFTGIEIEEWPARIAETALWLMDHQMNLLLSERFGQYFTRLPLRKAAKIVHGNALRLNWRDFVNPAECAFILGNPPFVGKHYQTAEQRADLAAALGGGFKNAGDLDYVAGWYAKAAEFIQGTRIRVGLVSTNSITQGEQVPPLWGLLLGRWKLKIHFAYRTFKWQSEARGKAHVHVVIIGFGAFDIPQKMLFEERADGGGQAVSVVSGISPYLTPGPDTVVAKRQMPLSPVPPMTCGSKPADGGHLILTDKEKSGLVGAEPGAARYLRRFTGSEEFINGGMRWCLWLEDAEPRDLRGLPLVRQRIAEVKAFREKSSAEPTRRAAATPALFFYRSQPGTDYILIPEVSSERRTYVPVGFMSPDVVASNKCFIIPSSDLFLFGVLSSSMHMAWMRQFGGRLKSDYSYSRTMVYNTFPWPLPVPSSAFPSGGACVREAASRIHWSSYHEGGDWPDEPRPGRPPLPPCPSIEGLSGDAKRCAVVEAAAHGVLSVREQHQVSTLADLYDPLLMPAPLLKAHRTLDRAVDRCYRDAPFASDRQRVDFLLSRYESMTAPLMPAGKKKWGKP